MRQPEHDGGDADFRKEGVRAPIVAGDNASPVLQPAEGVLNPMALPVERLVVGQWRLPVPGRGNAGLDATLTKPFPEPVAVVAAIAEQLARRR